MRPRFGRGFPVEWPLFIAAGTTALLSGGSSSWMETNALGTVAAKAAISNAASTLKKQSSVHFFIQVATFKQHFPANGNLPRGLFGAMQQQTGTNAFVSLTYIGANSSREGPQDANNSGLSAQ